jgi:hypothetical protein
MEEVKSWIEEVLEIEITIPLVDAIKSGALLCKTFNRIFTVEPIVKIHSLNSPFFQMENVGFFLEKCTRLGNSIHR